MASAKCDAIDETFGPWAGSCRGGFDFTLFFESTMLSIVPLCIMILFTPYRVLYLLRRRTKVVPSWLLRVKLMLYLALVVLQIALLVYWARSSHVKTNASIPNSAIKLGGIITIALLSYVEHQRTLRPSLMIEAYLVITILFDAARTRTFWLIGSVNGTAAMTTIWLILKIILLFVEAHSKQNILRPEYQSSSPEAISGLCNKMVFWWLNPLFQAGYRKTLSLSDLLPLDKHLTSHYLYHKLRTTANSLKSRGSNALLKRYLGTLRGHLFAIVPPRLGLIAFNFCQPFLIARTISYSEQSAAESPKHIGYGLIGAYFLVYCGIAMTTGQYQHLTYRAITMARGGLVSNIFAKTSLLKANGVDPASSITLMSADIERITNGWQLMNEMWANVIEIAIAIYLLAVQLGVACVVPLAVAIVSFLGSVLILNLVVKRQAEWLEAMEKRIGATGTMLGSMKRVKMCGLTDFLFEAIHSLRKHELLVSKGFRRLLIGSMFFAFTTPIIAPVLSFMVFSLIALRSNGQSTLSVGTAYTSLSLFALLAEPLSSLIMAMTAFAGSVGCFARIQAFLEAPEHVDKRSKPYQRSFDGSDDSFDSDETKTSEETITAEKQIVKYSFTEKFLRRRYRNDGSILQIEEGSFGWDTDKEPLISSIDISIPRDKLTIIVGPVGCGKTTLLKALLGEVPTLSGSVHLSMPSHISYCEQSSFHMNGTIQDSITAFTHFDERWYSTVIEACALDEDLQQLPLADQTRIGSKGVALSGGQCQRLALARAVYARNDICILDDVFSGLDMDTEGRVFHNLLGSDGLLRQHNSTVVLASSSNKRIPFADHIIVLDDKGHVAEQGSFKELTASGGFISGLDLPPADWKQKGNEASLDRLMSSTGRYTFTPCATKLSDDTLELEANQRTGDLSIYAYYANSVGWYAVVAFILAMCGYVFCYTFPQIWVGWWSEANAKHPNERLGYWLGIYALLGVGGLICLVISCWQIIVTMVPQSGASFHRRLLETVLSAPMAFFTTTDTGVTLNRFSQDLQLIDMDLPISALNFFTALLLCLAQIILIGVTSKYAAISFPFWFIALYFIQKFYLRTSRQLRFLDLEAKSPLYTQFTETLAGLTTVRAFGWQRALERQNRRMLDESQKPFYLLWAVQRWLQLVLDFLVTAVAVMLIIMVVELRGKIFGAYVGIAFLNIILFSQNLKLVLQYWTMLETHIGAITRIKNFTKAVASENLPGENSDKLPPQWPARGSISFHNVSASYDGSRKVLSDVNMTIAPGEKIAICGRTGSGKSSLTLALFRMIELSSGTITIDDIDISTISRQAVRSRIIGLPQDVLLLNGSVRTNVDPYGASDDAAIISALQDVHLWHRIEAKGGLDAEIDSIKLSHGQKQLFCLAQALLRKSSILILDEATSSVDDTTDALIQRLIRTKFAHHTILTVAHKLDTIADYDRVLVLDKGSMREFDGPNELLAQKGSVFRALWESYGGSSEVAVAVESIDDDITDEPIYGSKASTERGDEGTENLKGDVLGGDDAVKGGRKRKPRS